MSESLPELFNPTSRALPPFTVAHAVNQGGADNWQLTFPNGHTLSVLHGGSRSGAYCSNDTVELWAWGANQDHAWDDVRGWQSFSELLDAIEEVSSYGSVLPSATREITES